tara:strand:- start:179 stop:337 length:159 start_codon:yes stop_codon:yes gene_type:complete
MTLVKLKESIKAVGIKDMLRLRKRKYLTGSYRAGNQATQVSGGDSGYDVTVN